MLASIAASVSEITKKRFSSVAIVMVLSAFPMVLAITRIYDVDTFTFLRYFSGSINLDNIVISVAVTGCYIVCAIIMNKITKMQWCGTDKGEKLYEKV